MITEKDLADWFGPTRAVCQCRTYHPPTPEQVARDTAIREAAQVFARAVMPYERAVYNIRKIMMSVINVQCLNQRGGHQ